MNEKLILERLNDPKAKLVAVTKFHNLDEIEKLAELGVDTFGENRVQEFLTKYNPSKNWHWHLIGHLQTNKVKQVVGKVDLIESVDSLKLAREIEKQAAKMNLIQPVLIEVKISSDPTKTGLDLDSLDELLREIDGMEHVECKGLMTIGSLTDDRDITRREFREMKKLFDEKKKEYPNLEILSMGMSQDYPIAIEEGSNQVRIGTALFSDPNK